MNNIDPGYVISILILIVMPAIIYVKYKYKNKKSKKSNGFDSSKGFDNNDNGFG